MNYRWISVSLATLAFVGCAAHHQKMRPRSTEGTVVIPAPEASTNTAPADPTNPFVGASFYINPEYVKEVEDAAAASPENAATIKKVDRLPDGYLARDEFFHRKDTQSSRRCRQAGIQ